MIAVSDNGEKVVLLALLLPQVLWEVLKGLRYLMAMIKNSW